MGKKGFLDGYKTYNTAKGFGNAKQWKEAFKQRMTKDDAQRILERSAETPLTILGITTIASVSEIKNAYRNKLKEWHPDKNQHRLAEAEEMTKKIIAAYVTLIP